MTREELLERITPLTVFEQKKKADYESAGVLFGGELNPFYLKDTQGDFILSNERMASIEVPAEDTIHSALFPPSLRRKLRFIIHSRYAVIPFHHTEFVSINYVLEGRLLVQFRDRQVILQKGQLILMNSGIRHSLKFENEKDIILGIQIEKDFLSDSLLYGLRGTGPVANFLISEMTGKDSDFSFMITGFENDERVRNLFEDMFCEAIDARLDSAVMLENYMRLLFMSLIRATSSIIKSGTRADIAGILNYMDEHYHSCSLSDLSCHFHFNEKYLGNLIRRQTGQTFSRLMENIRMRHVAQYLESTLIPVQEIAAMCGYSNMTFFFRRFRALYGKTPAEYRSEMQQSPETH